MHAEIRITPLTEPLIKNHVAAWVGDLVNPDKIDMSATIDEVTEHGINIRIPSGIVTVSYQEIISADKVNLDFRERGEKPVWKDFKSPDASITEKRIHNYSYAPPLASRVRRRIETSMANELKAAEQQLASEFDPENIHDARERIVASIVLRRGQTQFREELLLAYSAQCAITDCTVKDVLEAAHIIPYKGPETNHVSNGLLLRSDVHTLFDIGLVAVDAVTMTILVSQDLARTPYYNYHRKPLKIPDDPTRQPNRAALEQHRRECGLIE